MDATDRLLLCVDQQSKDLDRKIRIRRIRLDRILPSSCNKERSRGRQSL